MPSPVLVIGHTDVGRRVCGLLEAQGVEVIHLAEPSDGELQEVLARPISSAPPVTL